MKSLILKKHISYKFIKRILGWHLNYYLFGRGTPLSAGVYINDVCNYKCLMCDIRMKDQATVYRCEDQKRDIDSLSKMGVIYYSVSGGEPTLVKDLPERLAYAASKIPYVHLVTNGSTMTKDLAKRLGKTGIQEISVSLDGLQEFHNTMRGVENSFEKSWNAVGLLHQHAPRIEIVINSILTPYNLDSLRALRKKILVAACDTFRAAAVDQLKNWVEKKDVDFFRGSFEQDPASVAFSACQKAQNEKYDYLIIDTAGRLSNNTNLLNQLVKIKSVVNKSISEKFIKTILVLDGTNGSNMINQVDIFSKSLDVSGLIITKIDGTAKGGALISIAKKYEIPIHCIGLGEKDDDLFEFNAKKFSRSLLDLDD